MMIHRAGLGSSAVLASAVLGNETLVATAGPTMPPNVAAAMTVLGATQNPYYNLIISLTQNPLASASGNNRYTASQIAQNAASAAAQYLANPQPAILQQYQGLWSYLPNYLANATIVDAWDQQNNWDTGINYTAQGQAAQAYLQAFFSAIGVTPPSTGGTSASGINLIPVLIIGGAAVLLLVATR